MTSASAENTRNDLRSVRHALRGVRRLVRTLLITRAVSLWIAAAAAGLVFAVAIDYALRLPSPLRFLGLVAGITALVWIVRTRIAPAIRFRPSLVDVALRIERAAASRGEPAFNLSGLLASGIELERSADGDPALRRSVTERAKRFYSAAHPRGLFRVAPALRAAALATACAVLFFVALDFYPRHVAIGLKRFLLPWSSATWPVRVDVEPVPLAEVHRADEALPLRAALLRAPGDPANARVTARVRVETETGAASPERDLIMTPQRKRAVAETSDAGELFEIVLEPIDLRPASGATREDSWLVYRFLTEDDETEERRVLITDPPALTEARVRVTPPDYLDAPATIESTPLLIDSAGRVEVGPILAGSTVELDLRWSEPVHRSISDDDVEAELSDTETLRLVATDPLTLELNATDRHGVAPSEPPTLVLAVDPDEPPVAAIVDPTRDAEVLPTARVGVFAEARDDLSLEALALERAITHAATTGADREAADEENQPAPEIVATAPPETTGRAERHVGIDTDLAPLGVAPGDEVAFVAVAQDGFRDDAGARAPIRSTPRTFRIISEQRFAEQVRGRLAGVERVAREIDDRQGAIQDRAASEDANTERLTSDQRAIGRDLGRESEALRDVAERMEANRFEDETLRSIVSSSSALLDEAQRASQRATESLAEEPQSPDAQRAAARQQDRVRETLGELLRRLAAGEDDYLARRELERLIDAQNRLSEATARAGAESLGKTADQLNPQERATLEELANDQQRLADDTAELIDRFVERSEQENADATQAAAMREAARAGQRAGVEQQLEQASEQIAQNQTNEAGQRQASAAQALQQMLEEIENAQQNRDDALRRELASLTDTLRALVERQRMEIERLEAARAGDADTARLDGFMIDLHIATLDLLDRAQANFAELATLAGLVSEATGRQSDAIEYLRKDAIDDAEVAERDALAMLEEALAEAEQVDEDAEQRQEEQLKREIRDAYAAALAEQRAIVDASTLVATGEPLSRRDRATARRLSGRQSELRETCAGILKMSEQLGESPVIELSHAELDRAAESASELLGRPSPPTSTLVLERRVAGLLEALVEAFSQMTDDRDDAFGEASGGGGGSGSGSQGGQQDEELVQAIAELRIMRSMQEQLLDLTRSIDGGGEELAGVLDRSSVAEMQRRLADRGEQVLEKLKERAAPPGGPPPVQVGEPRGDEAVEGGEDAE